VWDLRFLRSIVCEGLILRQTPDSNLTLSTVSNKTFTSHFFLNTRTIPLRAHVFFCVQKSHSQDGLAKFQHSTSCSTCTTVLFVIQTPMSFAAPSLITVSAFVIPQHLHGFCTTGATLSSPWQLKDNLIRRIHHQIKLQISHRSQSSVGHFIIFHLFYGR
jgi:hypothetical protein